VASPTELDIADWRRRVFSLYAEVRASEPRAGWEHWRAERERLYREHPASPVPVARRAGFGRDAHFDYDPALRALAEVEGMPRGALDVPASDGAVHRFERFGIARFDLHGQERSLELYWLTTYGNGIFLPFADDGGDATYAAGRYLLDTVKGADLGTEDGRLVLDFNFAFNPSCAHDPRWSCPLAPPANRLEVPVEGGERLPPA
jgi:uncharacterized protein (DUF1684 family)